ncbi:competence/damage-inducible protein A [soil metagenome]
MRAELVAVGSELLLGESVDTNSAWISARLAEIGVDVYRHTTVGDNVGRMVDVLGEALARSDAVIVTGGLGPTQDDLTRHAVARLAGVDLRRHDEIVDHLGAYFARVGRRLTDNNLAQADLPAGARVIDPVGTAPGFAVEVGGAVVYCLPGVPREMEAMIADDVVPELAARGGRATVVSRVVRTAGIAEAAVADLSAPVVRRLDESGNPTVAFLATRGETRVRVTGKAPGRAEALGLVDPVVDELVELLGTAVVGVDDEGVEHAVARQLHRLGWSLAVGESVTAGGVGARLATVPGASGWFQGGLVTYATQAKRVVAGVEAAVLEAHGPVSEPVAAGLAAGARDRLGADVALGVVGVAGPTDQDGVPVGTVCVAVTGASCPDAARTVRLPARTRVETQQWAASAALDFLRRRLADRVCDGR